MAVASFSPRNQSNGQTLYRQTALIDPYGLVTTYTYYDTDPFKLTVTEPGGKQIVYHATRNAQGYITDQYADAYDSDHTTALESVHYIFTSWTGNVHPITGTYVLSEVDYADGTKATYTYKIDNVQQKWPLLGTCDDVRFGGPMRQIEYDYHQISNDSTAIGILLDERRYVPGAPGTGEIVSTIDKGSDATIRKETRADGSIRTFTYSGSVAAARLVSYTDFISTNPVTSLTYFPRGDASYGFVKDRTDPRGNKTSYTRNAQAVLSVIHPSPDLSHIDYTYTTWPYQASKKDERGNITNFSPPESPRDSLNRITKILYPDQSPNDYETFTYNQWNQVTTHRLRNGNYEHFVYDTGTHLLTQQYNPSGVSSYPPAGVPFTSFSYYAANDPVGQNAWIGRLKTKTWPANSCGTIASETYEYDHTYDTNGNETATPSFGRGHVTKITYADASYKAFGFDKYGNKLWEENELRQRTNYAYDLYNRLLSVTDPLGHATSYTYSNIFGGTLGAYAHTTSCVRTVTDPAGIVTTNTYDLNCRKLSSTTGSSTTSYTYDAVGNVLNVTDPLGHITNTTYDVRDRKSVVTAAYGTSIAQATTFSYDTTSNVTSILRPDGKTEYKTYDEVNRLLTDTTPITSTTNNVVTIVPNPSGTVQRVTVTENGSANEMTSYVYDPSDRKIQMTYPNSTETQSWLYDDAGNLIKRTTVNGTYQTFCYDNRNRNTSMTWSNGADSATFAYDVAGHLTSASNPNSTVTRTYDTAGHLLTDTQAVVGNGTIPLQYGYDSYGRLA